MHPIACRIGPITVHWYGVMMALAFLVGVVVCMRLARKMGRDASFVSDMSCWIIIAGVIGARLAHVAANFGEYRDDPLSILMVQRGGLVFYGGFAGAGVGILLFAWLKRESPLNLYDLTTAVLPLSHALGRIGCFLNGCCYGTRSDGAFSVRYPLPSPAGWDQLRAHAITNRPVVSLMNEYRAGFLDQAGLKEGLHSLVSSGTVDADAIRTLPVHPVQLYEAGMDLLVFALLMFYFPRRKGNGRVVALYMMAYPLVRLCTEMFRGDERMRMMSLFGMAPTVAQLVSIGMFIVGAGYWIGTSWRERVQANRNG